MFLNPLQSCPKIGWQVYYIAETEDKYDGVFTIHQSLVYNTAINVSLQTQYSCTDSQQSGFPQFLPSWAAAHNTSRALALSPSLRNLHPLSSSSSHYLPWSNKQGRLDSGNITLGDHLQHRSMFQCCVRLPAENSEQIQLLAVKCSVVVVFAHLNKVWWVVSRWRDLFL